MSRKLLVTGATGLVGANLVRALLEQGENVRALIHQDRRALMGLDVETVSADVRDQESLERAMVGVDVVYHLAGSISIEMGTGAEMTAINAVGTHNVVAACLKCGVHRMLHFSSIDALQREPNSRPVDECQPLIDVDGLPSAIRRIPPYDLSKAQGEREVLAGIEAGLNAVILKPTALIGPNDFKPSYLGQALIQLANRRIPALVTGGFDWVDVRDVVAGAINAEKIAVPGACYILGGHWHTIREVAELVAACTNRHAPSITIPMWLADAFAPLMLRQARFNGKQPIYTRVTLDVLRSNRQVSSAKATRQLGYSSRPLSETVRDTLAWFMEHDYLRVKQP